MDRLKKPIKRENSPIIDWEQSRFEAVYKDIPASEIPDTAVAYLKNVKLYGQYGEVRPGTELWSDTIIPSPDETDALISGGGRPISSLPSSNGRDNYVLTKSVNTVKRIVGQEFTVDDILSWILWPDGDRDLIVGWTDADTVEVLENTVHADNTADNPAKLQRPMNANPYWHNESRKLFFFIGEEVYYTDYLISEFIKVPCLSPYPYNAKSTFDENKGFVYLFNYNGIYQIDTLTTPIEMYRINEANLRNEIESIEQSTSRNFGRRYLYTALRLGGTGNRNRGSSDTPIKKESGSNNVEKDNGYNDYKEIFFQSEPKDNTGDYYAELTGAAVGEELYEWTDLDRAGFNVDITTPALGPRDVIVDLTNTTSWDEIAKEIQDKLNDAYPELNGEAEVRYESGNVRFVMNAGTRNGRAITWLQVPGDPTATDISGFVPGFLGMGVGVGDIINQISSHVVGTDLEDSLQVPLTHQWMTHYGVYSTRKSNDDAINPDFYIWNEDVPVGKAFTASIAADGILTITQGRLETMDIGSWLRFENGAEYVIRVVLSDVQGRVNYTGDPIVEPVAEQACAIGGGRVMMARQYEDEVYTESDDFFEPDDLERVIYWSDGTWSIVKRYLSNRKVKVWNSGSKELQAITIGCVGRNFNDIITDKNLLSIAEVFPLRNRFWTPMPGYGLGVSVPGFLFTAPINGRKIAYCQIPNGFEYLAGHHYAPYQVVPVKDAIRMLREFTDRVVVYCANSTRAIFTNSYKEVSTPEVGELVAVLPNDSMVDPNIGIKDRGGVQNIEGGSDIMFTSDLGIRIFDGNRYSQNLLLDSDGKPFLVKDFEKIQSQVASMYEPRLGYVVWGSDRVDPIQRINEEGYVRRPVLILADTLNVTDTVTDLLSLLDTYTEEM